MQGELGLKAHVAPIGADGPCEMGLENARLFHR